MRCRGCTNALARDCGSLKLWRTGHGFRLKKVRIGYLDRLDIVVRNDHARAALREMPESNGKVIFQTDAAVRRRMPRHDTGMQRYP
jgi:hypothetical protein